MWPDFAKIRHLGKTLKVFGYSLRVYFVFGNTLTLTVQIFMILDKLSLLVMAQYSKDNLAIWSHCRWPLLPKFSHSSRGKHLWSLSLTLYLTTFLLTHYSNHVVFQLLTLSLCHSYSISIYWSHSHFPCFSIYLSFSLTHFQSHSDTHRHAFYILLATFLQTWRPLLSLSLPPQTF